MEAAAAKDCGLNPSQNGFALWRLTPAGHSPLEVLTHRWERYREALERSLRTRESEAARREATENIAAMKKLLAASGKNS